MPYDGEFADYGPLRRVVNNDSVEALLKRSRKRPPEYGESELPRIKFADLAPSAFRPTHIIAIDGSSIPVPMEDGFPGAEYGYVTVASVILNIQLLDELDQDRPVNPVEFRRTEDAESIDHVFPGCNIVIDEEVSAKSSLRKVVFELMSQTALFEDSGESLLDTYEALLEIKGEDEQRCPYHDAFDDYCMASPPLYRTGSGRYQCQCVAKYPLYSTDALRFHERFRAEGSNVAIYTEIMLALERLWLVHILRAFESNNYLRLLKNFAFVLDGPLAVFGQPAWLSNSIKQELQRINEAAKVDTDGTDMLIIGVEKSGAFVEHFDQLVRTTRSGEEGELDEIPFNRRSAHHMGNSLVPPQTACLLTDDYIKRNIIYSESEREYGRQTYFGRKFFYRSRTGAQIVASLPFLNARHENVREATPENYPRLADAMALFDQLVSSRYPNSLAPIVAAHSEAAIPLNLGRKVLERMARELMKPSE